jgi:hypothetical protein
MDQASWAVHHAEDSRITPFHRPVTIVLNCVSPLKTYNTMNDLEKWEFIAFIRSQSASRNTQLFCDTFAFLVHNHTSMPRDPQGKKSLLFFKHGFSNGTSVAAILRLTNNKRALLQLRWTSTDQSPSNTQHLAIGALRCAHHLICNC